MRYASTFLLLPLAASVLGLAGCANPFGQEGYFRDKSGDYADAKLMKTMEIPKGMDTLPIGDQLVIPEISPQARPVTSSSDHFVVPRPELQITQPDGNVYRIEADGNSRWLQVNRSFDDVWADIVRYLDAHGIAVSHKSKSAGTMESVWLIRSDKDKPDVLEAILGKWLDTDDFDTVRERIRITVKSAHMNGMTLVTVVHQGSKDGSSKESKKTEALSWNNMGERSQKTVQALLGDMMIFMAKDSGTRDALVSYQDKPVKLMERSEVDVDGGGNPVLNVRGVSFSHGWNAVGDALSRSGIKVIDKNRDAGLYYLSMSDVEKAVEPEPGFFSKLFGSKKKSDTPESSDIFHLRVSVLGDMIQVSLEKDSLTSVPARESGQLLKQIRQHLQ
ncbi:Outer membrane protein assembly factor BamC [invertebrate metagenome]|uniref:Outer membrane protein assembly factor BamC n=1 Tax=invertebrate metagenome TaxID=1711999 RepID=A0A2H9TA89_9ZZZZ